jgi:hypothetical protein
VKKIDLRKELKHLYSPSAKAVAEVKVPRFTYLMIDGQGDPNTSADYAAAVEALFSVSYTAKFMLKKGPTQQDYAVMPLEGLWWADDLGAFAANDRANWRWTMMILQPPCATRQVLRAAMAAVTKKKALSAVAQLRVESFTEGRCAQILHIGPFSAEGPTIERLHDYIRTHSARRGKHHEIYLTDIRRAAPARWKTIVRQPME